VSVKLSICISQG